MQLIRRRSLWKVDRDIIILGIYYVIVILGYLIFEMYPVNYRPIFIEGRMEASYPSSTTLLVLSVMPTLSEQVNRRMKEGLLRKTVKSSVIIFAMTREAYATAVIFMLLVIKVILLFRGGRVR